MNILHSRKRAFIPLVLYQPEQLQVQGNPDAIHDDACGDISWWLWLSPEALDESQKYFKNHLKCLKTEK